jgi:hypothetical protein
LGNLLRDNWDAITGCTTITLDEVNRATVLAQLLFRSAESRNERAAIPADLVRLKKQVYTLFLLAYDELRRCLEFIERGAADRVAPSLYQGWGRKSRVNEYAGRTADAQNQTQFAEAGETGPGVRASERGDGLVELPT